MRGEGLLAAVEFVRDRDDRVFFDTSEKIGASIAGGRRHRPALCAKETSPPLCLTKEEADTIVTATRATVESVTAVL